MMLPFTRNLIALCMGVSLSVGSVAPATAGVVEFRFVQNNALTTPGVFADGTILIDEATFNSKLITVAQSSFFPPQSLDLSGTGIDLLDFSVATIGGAQVEAKASASSNSFQPFDCGGFPGACGPYWAVFLSNAAIGGIPTGSISFNNTNDDFSFGLGDPAASGTFNTDNSAGGVCHGSGVCTFAGVWERVPEPATLGLLGIGLIGLISTRRRRDVR